ncbi:MAG: hypothetical protein [Circular genetic element sp.]|nr:MAG: hypothetical protein [Circular genetic element sp.]
MYESRIKSSHESSTNRLSIYYIQVKRWAISILRTMLLPINKLVVAEPITKAQILHHNGTARVHVDNVNDKQHNVRASYIYIREANTVEATTTSHNSIA